MKEERDRLGIIHWFTPEKGGRHNGPVPAGVYYPTTILPVELLPVDSPTHWSLKIVLEQVSDSEPYLSFGTIGFLFDHAPHSVLFELDELPLYEGPRIIANVVFEK